MKPDKNAGKAKKVTVKRKGNAHQTSTPYSTQGVQTFSPENYKRTTNTVEKSSSS